MSWLGSGGGSLLPYESKAVGGDTLNGKGVVFTCVEWQQLIIMRFEG